ncbi:MAG: hypothetical protein GWP06_12435 [Actinobacteria bacterium]|nr:hypothetical protein [Actinomycetota bacterium]
MRNESVKINFKKIAFVFIIAASLFILFFSIIPRKPRYSLKKDLIFENDHVKVLRTGQIKLLFANYLKDDRIYATEDHFVFCGKIEDETFHRLGHFSKINPDLQERARDFIGRLKISRFFRKNIVDNQIVVLESGTILVFYDHIYRSTDGGRSYQSVFQFDKNIFNPFHDGIAVDNEDTIYFGEYNCSKRPHKIRIFKGTADGTKWDVCYEFPAGQIFHVHSIKYDSYRNRLWICTGDRNEESRLMYTDDKFDNVNISGSGDQNWRIVSLIIGKDYLFWCSDNDSLGSNIYRFNVNMNRREKLFFVGKPSYYSKKLSDGTLAISTTYEPESSFTKETRPHPTTDIWISRKGLHWYRILELPHKSFQTPFGESRSSIVFPSGDYNAESLYFSPQNTVKLDKSLQKFSIQWKPDSTEN